MHSDVETFALLAKQVLFRDTAICEDQLVCSRSTDTHLLLFGTEGEARSSFLYDKCRDLFFLSALYFNNACYSDDNVNVSLFTISNENFGAV